MWLSLLYVEHSLRIFKPSMLVKRDSSYKTPEMEAKANAKYYPTMDIVKENGNNRQQHTTCAGLWWYWYMVRIYKWKNAKRYDKKLMR